MELLELKSVWDAVVQDAIAKNKIDKVDVSKSIRQDSKTVLAKIKRVMYFKFIVGGLTLSVCLVLSIGLFINPEKFHFLESVLNLTENKIFVLSVVIFISGLLGANYLAFREIKSFNNSTSIRTSLQRFIKIMSKTIKLNTYSGAIFNAFIFTWIFYATAFRDEPFSWGTKGLIVLAVPFVTLFLFYLLGRYEQHIKFGKFLKQLKYNLEGMDEI